MIFRKFLGLPIGSYGLFSKNYFYFFVMRCCTLYQALIYKSLFLYSNYLNEDQIIRHLKYLVMFLLCRGCLPDCDR